MALKIHYSKPEYLELPNSKMQAIAKNENYFYTGKPCSKGHYSPRYSSGNCTECLTDKGNTFDNRTSLENQRRAKEAFESGQTTYVPERPCSRGHSIRYCKTHNCVTCNSISMDKKKADGGRWKRISKIYGLTKEGFENLNLKQNGCCAICFNKLPDDTKVHIDHCHSSGKVRGLLCSRCNQAIGLLKENTETLLSAIRYLESNK